MSSTDNRIVRMEFDNSTFKKRAAETKQSLADVNKAVDAAGKNKGLLDMNSNIQKVQVSASKMTTVMTAGIATITAKAVDAGLRLVKGLTLDPIRSGFAEYESLLTKQNVIMNATGKSSTVVKGVLRELNTYSDKTIYSFGNMTDAITKFVNAGIDLPTAVTSIKGIANAAAFAGANAEEANRAMYAFSQSMSLGYVQLQDWNQIENANMGTIQFKEELIKAGLAAGTLTKNMDGFIVTSEGTEVTAKGMRNSLKDAWATTEVLNIALGKYADQSTELGKKAYESATQVRTFSAFMDTLKESLGSGWSQIFRSLFGGLKGATSLWTGLSEAVGGVVGRFFTFTSATLRAWRNMGGFEKTIQGFKNIISPIAALFMAIGTAFKSAFPRPGKGAGAGLYGLSVAFEAITRPLTWLAKGITATTPVLKTFFQIVKIGVTAIKEAASFIGGFVTQAAGLVSLEAPSGGGFLDFIKKIAKAIADAVDKISDLLSKGQSLTQAFGAVNLDLPSMPSLPSLPSMPSIGSIFGGDGGSAAADETKIASLTGGVMNLASGLADLKNDSDDVVGSGMFNPNAKLDTSYMADAGNEAQQMGDKFKVAGTFMVAVKDKILDGLKNLKDGFVDFIKSFTAQDILEGFNMAVMATFVISLIRMINTIRKGFAGFAGIGDGVAGVLDSAGGALKSFQTAARAKLILNIALAVAILVASLWVLSKIPGDKLKSALAALGTVLFMASLALKSLTQAVSKMDGDMIVTKMFAISAAMIALGFAMILLAGAMLLMRFVRWEDIGKGILVMVVAIESLKYVAESSESAWKSLLASSVAITAVAWAMILLAGALVLFRFVQWDDMGKAGVTLLALTIAIGLLAKMPYQSLFGVAAAMTAVGLSSLALATALIIFSKVKLGSIGKLALTLAAVAAAVIVMTRLGGPAAISGLVGIGLGMIAIATAGMILNKVDWESIKKIAVILGAIVVAVALLGAVAYFAAGPIALLGLGIAAVGAGVALFGAGVALFVGAMATAIALGAAGVAAFAAIATAAAVAVTTFLQTLAAEAPIIKQALLDILQEMINGFVEAVPMVIQGIKDLWAAVMKEFGGGESGGGAKGAAMNTTGQSWISKLAEGIKKKLPQAVKYAAELLIGFLKGLGSKAKELAAAGVELVVKLVEGITSKIGKIVTAAADLLVEFAEGIGDNLPKIVKAGIQLLADWINAMADGIRNASGTIGPALLNLVGAFFDLAEDIIDGLVRGLKAFAYKAWDEVKNLADGLKDAAWNALKINSPSKVFMEAGKSVVEGLAKGVKDNAAAAIVAVASMVGGQIAMANEYINRFIQDLDQKAIAARGRADGLAAAAERARKAASKTKTKKDDKAAERMSRGARQAEAAATRAENKAQAKKEAQDRAEEFRKADLFGKAKMKSEDAQKNLDEAKAAQRKAQAARVEADALDKQAKAAGLTKKQRKELREEADRLRKAALGYDKDYRNNLTQARKDAAAALQYQKEAGAEAAAAFEEQFKSEAQQAADKAAFEKLSDADKAKQRRADAARLKLQSERDLTAAKKLAFTDLEGANALAQVALAEAEAARQALEDAARYEESGPAPGTLLNLDPAAEALAAFQQYADAYSAATAAAAATPTVEFNQYNTSPESLSPSEVYRQTNNLLTFAADAIAP